MAHFSTKLQCTGPVWDWPSSPAHKIFGLNVRQNWREQSEMLNALIYLFNVLESVGLVPLCRMFTLIPSSITVSFHISTITFGIDTDFILYFQVVSLLYSGRNPSFYATRPPNDFLSLSLKQVSSGLCRRRRHCGRGRRSRCRVLRPATTSILL